MTSKSKSVIGTAGIVAVVALVGFYALRMHTAHEEAAAVEATDSTVLPTSASDNSDAALAKDSAAIDAQMNGMQQDDAAIDGNLAPASH